MELWIMTLDPNDLSVLYIEEGLMDILTDADYDEGYVDYANYTLYRYDPELDELLERDGGFVLFDKYIGMLSNADVARTVLEDILPYDYGHTVPYHIIEL